MKIPYYTRFALVGIGLQLSIVLVILVVTAIYDRQQLAYPFIVGGLVAVVGAAIYFWRPWGLFVGAFAGLIGITFALDAIGENLSSPDSFLDFAYRPVFWAAGTIFLLVGCCAGLVQHFRGRTSFTGPRVTKVGAAAVLATVAVLGLFSAALTLTGVEGVAAEEKQGAARLKISAWDFNPEEVAIDSSSGMKLLVKNNDPIVHSFTIDELDIDVKFGPRDEKLIDFDLVPAGTYALRCRIIGHGDMAGTITVSQAAQ
jgi:uncharacterized cupredoxin-like copper-binding protein